MNNFFRISIAVLAILLFSCGKNPAGEGDDGGGSVTPPSGTRKYVASAADLQNLGTLAAGDTIVWKNGNYNNADINFTGNGTQDKKIVLIAEEAGKVVFGGSSAIKISGKHIVLDGFWFKDIVSVRNKAIITVSDPSENCMVLNCAITGIDTREDKDTDYKWLSLYGRNHTVRGCSFIDKRNIGTTLVVWMKEGVVPGHLIEKNKFTRPVMLTENGSSINGQETIRIGTSDYSMQQGGCTVRANYFYRCDGETEVISNKSCGNIYEDNVFEQSQGTLTLRHGNDCTVRRNFFIGNNTANTGGIRVIGENHLVEDNYLESLRGSGYKTGICLVRGETDPALNGYWQVRNCIVRNNTLVNCRYAFQVNYGSNQQQNVPVTSTRIYGNVVSTTHSSDYTVNNVASPAPQIEWSDNIIYGGRQSGITLPTVSSAPAVPSREADYLPIIKAAGINWVIK